MSDLADDPRAYLLDGAEAIGHEHWIRRTVWTPPDKRTNPPYVEDDDPTEPYGVIVVHRRPDDGKLCAGGVPWAEGVSPRWTLVSEEPLHVEPSVLCLLCGDHGFIRGGTWHPA